MREDLQVDYDEIVEYNILIKFTRSAFIVVKSKTELAFKLIK